MPFDAHIHQRLIKAALYDRECELLGTVISQAAQIEQLQQQLLQATSERNGEPRQDEQGPTPIPQAFVRRRDSA